VVDERGRGVEPGSVGDLCARGPNVMLGYWNDPETTSRTIEEGWLRTGDVATVDGEGYFFVQSRKDDLIKTQGLRTHPREIEELVSRHFPGFRVLVVPYRFHNATRLALYLVSGSGSEELPVAEIRRLCLRALPRPKVPSYIEVLERAPLNESMKLDREGLVRRAEEGSAAGGGSAGPKAAGSLEKHALGSGLAVDQERMSP
jgi:long-chain acyl-CoA synthetase